MAKGNCLLGPKIYEKHRRLLNNGLGALPEVFEAYMGEVALQTDPTRYKTAWHPRVLACGSKVAKYASRCYNGAPTTRWSIQDWTFMGGSPQLTIGYTLREKSRMHV